MSSGSLNIFLHILHKNQAVFFGGVGAGGGDTLFCYFFGVFFVFLEEFLCVFL